MKRNQWIAVGVALVVVVAAFGYNSYLSDFFNQINMDQQGNEELSASAGNVVLPDSNGLIKEDEVVGSGETAMPGDQVTVNYTGTFTNGTKFDSSYDHGQPFSFLLGGGNVIAGWDLGVAGMKVGGKRKLTIPPQLGYGENDFGPIPGNSTLIFEVELVGVQHAAQ